MEKSLNHICFAGQVEFFSRDGSVYRAPSSACIMPDGYRCGRWECSEAHWVNCFDIILKPFMGDCTLPSMQVA
jgi:hypothetical protein